MLEHNSNFYISQRDTNKTCYVSDSLLLSSLLRLSVCDHDLPSGKNCRAHPEIDEILREFCMGIYVLKF